MDSNSPEYRAFIKAVEVEEAEKVDGHLGAHPEFLDLPNIQGMQPLHCAVWSGRRSTVALLLKRGSTSINATDGNGATPLHFAAMIGDDSLAVLLLEHGSAINSAAGNGSTPLDYAAWMGNDSVVELLLKHGCTLDFNEMSSPLHSAAMYGRDSTIRILKGVGMTTQFFDGLGLISIRKLQEVIPEDEIAEIRFRIYFSRSLLSCLLS